MKIEIEVFNTCDKLPELNAYRNYVTVLGVEEGESEFLEMIFGKDKKFRYGYDEKEITVVSWSPLIQLINCKWTGEEKL